MANSSSFLLVFYLLSTTMIIFSVVAEGSGQGLSWVPTRAPCRGSMAECMMDDVEFEMDSEINRRILATTNYISYDSLRANSIPCSQRGASYYNCKSGGEANPYDRGCSAISRCRS